MSNLINLVPESTCKYLFGQEAEQLFTRLKGSAVIEKRKFVDQCLELSMRVNIFILSSKDGFFLIDPMAFNNQCHLYSFRAALIMKTYSHKTAEEKLAKTEENRFLHLSFFLSYSLISDTRLLIKAVNLAMKNMSEKSPVPTKHFVAFLKDEGKYREKASRQALNNLFECELKNSFSLLKEERALYADLFKLAHENLRLGSSHGRKGGELYTYPKFAGVAYMIDRLAKENIAFVVKVKVITKNGAAGTISQASGETDKEAPVVVFEAIATDGSYSVPYCMEEAKRCPTYFYRHQEKNKRHQEEGSCFFCKKTTIDLEPFRRRLQTAMRSPDNMFYALGADFILQVQRDFQVFFEDDNNYPCLSNLFRQAVPVINELGLNMNNPTTFSVCHVHTDSASHALSDSLLLEASPEELLNKRGVA